MTSPVEIADRLQALYSRLKNAPELRHTKDGFVLKDDAFLALLDLRNELPGVIEELRKRGDFVSIPRMRLGKVEE